MTTNEKFDIIDAKIDLIDRLIENANVHSLSDTTKSDLHIKRMQLTDQQINLMLHSSPLISRFSPVTREQFNELVTECKRTAYTCIYHKKNARKRIYNILKYNSLSSGQINYIMSIVNNMIDIYNISKKKGRHWACVDVLEYIRADI